MENEYYELIANDGEILHTTDSWYDLIETLVNHIVDEMWNSDMREIIDNCYDSVEIAGNYYDASEIVENCGDLREAVERIIKDEMDNIKIPDVDNPTYIDDYGGCTIICKTKIRHVITTALVMDGDFKTVKTIFISEDEFNDIIVNLVKSGCVMVGSIYRDDVTVKACLVKMD